MQDFQIVNGVIRNFPIAKTSIQAPKKFYSLFVKSGKSWRNCRTVKVDMPTAYKIWGDLVNCEPNTYSIRRIELN